MSAAVHQEPAEQEVGLTRTHVETLGTVGRHAELLEEDEVAGISNSVGHGGDTTAPFDAQLHLPLLPLSPRHHHQLLTHGSTSALFRTQSIAGNVAPALHLSLDLPLVDLGLAGSLPQLHAMPGLFGLPPASMPAGLLSGLNLDQQPLSSYVVGKMEPTLPHFKGPSELAHGLPGSYGSGEQDPLGLFLHHQHLMLHPQVPQGQRQQHETSTGPSSSVRRMPRAKASPAEDAPAPAGSVPQPRQHAAKEEPGVSQHSGEEAEQASHEEETEEEALKSSSEEEERPRKRRGQRPAATTVAAAAAATPRKRAQRGSGESGAGTKLDRSSRFRGVTKHRRSGHYEAHIWVRELGRQVYLGGYEQEEHAAEAFDIAALKCKGRRVKTNFEIGKYADLLGCIGKMSMEELVMAVRRQSQGFSRGSSSYRGVTHHPSGRWEARIGVPGSKHIYLGLFAEEADAARAYDRALVRLRGRGAATNFALSDYRTEMADYHQMQSRTLKADERFAEIQSTPALLERFLKSGCENFPDLASPSGAAQQEGQEDQQAQ